MRFGTKLALLKCVAMNSDDANGRCLTEARPFAAGWCLGPNPLGVYAITQPHRGRSRWQLEW